MLHLVATVERAAPTTAVAVQWLRRLFYSGPLGGAGSKFDDFLRTDASRSAAPVTTSDVPQSVLDAVVRVGSVVTTSAAPLTAVDLSHVFVLLDLRINGPSARGQRFEQIAGRLGPITLAAMLSWAGDLGSAWLGFQDMYNSEKAKAGKSWDEPVATAGDLATPLGWLADGIRGRSPIEDLLGDLDGVAIVEQPLPPEPTPLARMLANYYTLGSSTAAERRVDDRFQHFVTSAVPRIPHTSAAGVVSLEPGARASIRSIITDATFWLLASHRKVRGAWSLLLERGSIWDALSTPWSSRMLDELADRFTAFLADGLAGRPVTWPARRNEDLPYPGYQISDMPHPPLKALTGKELVKELEALAQFHLNWQQPHRPLRVADRVLRPVQLSDPVGTAARIVAGAPAGMSRISLDPFIDLRQVVPAAGADHRDLIRLDADAGPQLYRIRDVDPDAGTVTVVPRTVAGASVLPAFADTSSWRILRRATVVIVDPWGGRMGGAAATPGQAPAPASVTLDGAPDLDRLVANFDMVYLEDDSGRPSRTYRVVRVDPVTPTIHLDAAPVLAGPTRWRIPAGAADVVTTPAHLMNPAATGCDRYDALAFVVYADELAAAPLIFSSYTSIRNVGEHLSSVAGNARYDMLSYRSGNSFRNYSFKVTDPKTVADMVAEGAFFFEGATAQRHPPAAADPSVTRDPNGKSEIRIHYGNTGGHNGTGSAGCIVSPMYYDLRSALICIHQEERVLLDEGADASLNTIAGETTHQDSVDRWNGTPPHAPTVPDADWTNRLLGELILVRPDRRPIV